MKISYSNVIWKALLIAIFFSFIIALKNLYILGFDQTLLYYGDNKLTTALQLIIGFIFGILITLKNFYRKRKKERKI